MRVILISDTHNMLNKSNVPPGEILIHTGDATGSGTIQEIVAFKSHLDRLPHPCKIFVPGNHDWLFERQQDLARNILGKGVHILVDEEVNINGLRIYGTPWTPRFYNWAFNVDRGAAILEKWKKIPSSLDILLTHGPPHGILDINLERMHVGCEMLRDQLNSRIRCKLHAFGHIHHGYGVEFQNGSYFANASICNEGYKIANDPILFEIDPTTKSLKHIQV